MYGPYKVINGATSLCLAADYANTYSYGCSVYNQIWYFDYYSAWGSYRLINYATGYCLTAVSYSQISTVPCTGALSQLWLYDGYLESYTQIGRYLSTDYSTGVYLAQFTSNQNWALA